MNGPYLALILVTGSRSWDDVLTLNDALLETWHDATQDGHCGITVMHGGAVGADHLAGIWARAHQEDGVGHDQIDAQWTDCANNCPPGHRKERRGYTWCPTAGHRRNQQMVNAGPLLCLAFHRGQSTGTADCIRRAETAGIPVRRYEEAA
ncbi:SLOG family protein [Streptomyces sp. CBMA152]|uniref:SLOG family protein n=1 Tax=Streptomyces sp. CBMA152 TaxID=1896312 RepID=UPI0016614C59|nr:SLOG family protein [Streptomyces sp. CBMA152]